MHQVAADPSVWRPNNCPSGQAKLGMGPRACAPSDDSLVSYLFLLLKGEHSDRRVRLPDAGVAARAGRHRRRGDTAV